MLGNGEKDVPSKEGIIAARRGGAPSSLEMRGGGASSSLMLATRGELDVPSKEGMIATNQIAKKAMEPDLGQSSKPPLHQQEDHRQDPETDLGVGNQEGKLPRQLKQAEV